MDKQEIIRAIEQSTQGNWIPLAFILGTLGIVVWMFIYILRVKEATLNKRHDNCEDIMKSLTVTQHDTRVLMERVLSKQDMHDEEIKEIKRKVK